MGERPTIDRVRMRLGRGSPNTINEHLDAWWAKLGARLRDLPGQEFPQLPERVAHSLQQLWNEALAGAHDVLQATLLEREQSLLQRETVLQQASLQLAEREQAAHARATALEDNLTLAREQLAAANQRARHWSAAFRSAMRKTLGCARALRSWRPRVLQRARSPKPRPSPIKASAVSSRSATPAPSATGCSRSTGLGSP